MSQELVFDGDFWLPADPGTKIVGILTSSPRDGTTLQVIGSYSGITDRLDGAPEPDYRRIIGLTDRRYVTLEDCRLAFDNPFGRRQRFIVARLLVNVAYEDLNERAELNQLDVHYSDFGLWVAEGGPEMVPDRELLADGNIPYVGQQIESVQLAPGVILGLVHRLALTHGQGELSLRQRALAVFKFDVLSDLDSALEFVFDLLPALTIACDRVVGLDSVTYSSPNLKRPVNAGHASVDVHAQWLALPDLNRKLLISDYMAFTYGQLGGIDGLGRLVRTVAAYRSYVRQALRARYDRQPLVQDAFLGRVAALEGFDKMRHPGPPHLDRRLHRLVQRVGGPFARLIGAGQVDRWCARAVQLRNNIAHGDPIPLHQSEAELYYMSEAAYWLLILNVLLEAKAPQGVFDHLTGVCTRFRWTAKQLSGIVASRAQT